jgi:hypothetical protein
VKKLTLIVNEFRKINPDITANQMLVLLHAGAKPGIMQKELSAATDLADGTISRICALMSDRGHESRSMAPRLCCGRTPPFSPTGTMIAARAWTAWKQAMWAPIRRHRLATVGTRRADRGPENCPQVRPPLRELKQSQDLQSGSNGSGK